MRLVDAAALLTLALLNVNVAAATVADVPSPFYFRVYLKDKGANTFSVTEPDMFLSSASVERRMLREAPVDESDFPVSTDYLNAIVAVGAQPVVTSRWLNTVAVACNDSATATVIAALDCVDSLKFLHTAPPLPDTARCASSNEPLLKAETSASQYNVYGEALQQAEFVNGVKLHNAGFRGRDVRIAVIDAGFMNVERIEAFAQTHIIATRNIVSPSRSVFCEDRHGTRALSCLAANLDGVMVGSAPEASYILVKSEDQRAEFPLEEDLWAAAVEYADSFGVDIISSSLGYFRFDELTDYYTVSELNGTTAFCSRIAAVAASKGHLLVVSAGNEGASDWQKVTFPADVDGILTVGSCDKEKERSSFSSYGTTADYRIKPDVVALGSGVCVIDSDGQTVYANGTSFSSPIVAGFIACLMQAFPLLKNYQLIQLVKQTASRSLNPDVQLGCGIPDMYNAYLKAHANN